MKAMKVISILSSLILGAYAVFAIVWIWSDTISAKVFIKTSITAGIVLVAIVIIGLAYKEYIEERNMKKEKFLD